MLSRLVAAIGVTCIEQSILNLLEKNPEGLRNVEIARELNLDFERQFITWEILQRLVKHGTLVCHKKKYRKP